VTSPTATLSSNELKDILRIIGLARNDGELYINQREKYQESLTMAEHIAKIANKITKRKTLMLLDCACGKAYLSFLLNYALTEKIGRSAYFIGVDNNAQLIGKCIQAQQLLGFKNMEFHATNIMELILEEKPDITYCLHACDTATDETIAKGIISDSRFITAVPCCQREISNKIRNHPLTPMTQFSKIKEQLCSLITDSMRALILAASGYKVEIFEFIPSKITPKNLMLRAEKIRQNHIEALEQYWQLRNLFNVRPKIEEYLTWLRP
jgi:hypothetical protein